MLPFNLLQYPALASQRRKFHRRWTSLTGLLVGSLLCFGLISMAQEKRVQRVQEGLGLQSRLEQVQKQLAADKVQQVQQNIWLQQDARIKALSAQQRRWEALHQALLHEAGPHSVQLLRLQLDAQTLELHGQAKDVNRMAQARLLLSKPLHESALDTDWKLVSLVNVSGAAGGTPQATLEFVWQAAWPLVGSGSVATAAVLNPQSLGPDKDRP